MDAEEGPAPAETGGEGDDEASDAAREFIERIESLRAKYPPVEAAAWKAAVSQRLLDSIRGTYSESRDPMAGRDATGASDAPALPGASRALKPEQAAHPILSLLDEMIVRQRAKVLAIARRIEPNATFDDTLQPHDNPKIDAHPLFQFEDGLLAGLLAAQAAIRARLQEGGGPPSEDSL